jgi:hypothetical protein
LRAEIKKRSYRVERNFGLVVGGVFVALSLYWLLRGKFQLIVPYLLIVGASLIVSGLIVPKALVWPNRLWMALAEVLSFVMTRLILAIVFFMLVTPIGLLRKMVGGDPLNRRAARAESYWKPYLSRQSDPRHYEKMF